MGQDSPRYRVASGCFAARTTGTVGEQSCCIAHSWEVVVDTVEGIEEEPAYS